jgi:hypothetical protein
MLNYLGFKLKTGVVATNMNLHGGKFGRKTKPVGFILLNQTGCV